MTNPYDRVVSAFDIERADEARRRREEATQRQIELGTNPQRVTDAQRLSRQQGRPVTPQEVPDALRDDQVRRVADLAARSARFARVFADPRLAGAMSRDVDEQARVSRAAERATPRRTGQRYRFDGMSAAAIAATLDREEEVEASKHGWFWRVMHTDLGRAVGLDLRPDVVAAERREDISRSDGFLDDVGDLWLRGLAQADASLADAGSAFNSWLGGITPRNGLERVLGNGPVFDSANRDAARQREQSRLARDVAAVGRENDTTQAQADEAGFFSRENARFVGQQVVLSGPSIAASLLGRFGMIFNTTTISGSVARSRAENQGREDPNAGDLAAALPFALTSAALDRFSGSRLLRPGSSQAGVGAVASRVYRDAGLEAATEGVQSAIEYTGGVAGTGEDWSAQQAWDQARAGALIGFAVGGAISTGNETVRAGVNRASPAYQNARRQASGITRLGDSELHAEAVGEIMDSATRHASRAADPEIFREAIQAQIEGTPIENLYIGIEALDRYLQSEGAVDPEGLFNSYGTQIAEARLTGSELVIPLSEFAMAAAGTPAWEALREDIRPSQSAMTPREIAASRDEIMAEIEARGAEIAAQSEGLVTLNQDGVQMVRVGDLVGFAVHDAGANPNVEIDPERAKANAELREAIAAEGVKSPILLGVDTSRGTAMIRDGNHRAALANEIDPDMLVPVEIRREALKRAQANGTAYDGRFDKVETTVLEQAQTDPAVKVYEQVREQLRAVGYKTGDARKYAGLVAAHRANMAEMMGVTAEQYHADNPIEFARERKTETREVLQQAPLSPAAQVEIKMAELADKVPGASAVLPYLSTEEKADLKVRSVEKLVALFDQWPSAEEMASVAFSGRAKRGWYERSSLALLDIFGMQDAPRFAALLAALSPQTSVESNAINAIKTWTNWDIAGRPTDRQAILDVLAKSVQGGKGMGSVLNAWINNSMTALTTESPHDIVLSGPKVNSFMLNLMGVMDEVTNDTWMANFAAIDQAVFAGRKGPDGKSGKGLGYKAASAVVRNTAEILTARTGEMWTPAEVQETVWSWVKVLTEKRANSGPISAEKILAAGGLTHADLATTPDFAQLFIRGVYRRSLEVGGYSAQLLDIERSGRADGPYIDAGSAADAEGAGIPRDAFDHHLRSSAARIDTRYAERYAAQQDDRQLSFFQGPLDETAPVPLTGLPTVVKVDGMPREFGPYQVARDAAQRVADRLGRVYTPPTTYAKVDVERAQRIAAAYEAMPHQPNDPQVKAAYDALIAETMVQWDEIKKTGLQVEFIVGDDPYGNPRHAILDVVENNHLWVFPTDSGFGSSDLDVSDNPLLGIVEGELWSGQPVRVNDVFRVVHDYFGHIAEGLGFRAAGEENAWRMHSAMYSPLARKALTSETRGQNSWVNFGPHGEANQTADGASTVYADQKIGLLPDWVVTEGANENEIAPSPGNSVVGQTVYRGAFSFPDPASSGPLQQPMWFSESEGQANTYASGRRVQRRESGKVYPAKLDIRNPIDLTGAPSSLEDPKGWVASLGLPPSAFTLDNGSILTYRVFTRPEFVDALRAQGYDGIKVDEGGVTTWAVLSTDQVRSAGDPAPFKPFGMTLYQNSDEIFYSALERAVEKGPKRASGDQWASTLRNASGIKADELEWTGVIEWLADSEGAYDRDEVLDFVKARGVQVDEVVNEIIVGENFAGYPQRDEFEDEEDYTNAVEEWESNEGFDSASQVQFKGWSSDPSNDTYRELLITLPLGERGNPERAASTHWDQPGVVAHARFMDKTDVDGARVLFIEEVQSDWHQKGRDQGYETGPSPEAIAAAQAKYDAAADAYLAVLEEIADAGGAAFAQLAAANPGMKGSVDRWLEGRAAIAQRVVSGDINDVYATRAAIGDEAYPTLVAKYGAARSTMHLVGRELDIAKGLITNGGIPNAPFKKSWPALVMKRMIRWAAENGYDKIAWTTGAQQAERYNLSTATGPLVMQGRDDEGRLRVAIEFAAGQRLRDNNLAALTGPTYGTRTTIAMTEEQAREAFGSEIAEKLIGAPDMTALDGSDLNVGGEGMKAFYDRNLVNITNDIVKRFGAKVGPVVMSREDVLADDMARREFMLNNGRPPTAEERLGAEKTQPGFEITQKMRESALGGFPLFQTRPQGARGQVEFTDGKAVITLFERADPSTLIHELGHVFFEEMRRNVLSPNAPAALKADWGTLKQWLAVNGAPVIDDVISRDGHELIARGFERYAMEGNAPSSALSTVFTKFRQWLQSIYATVEALRAPITPEVRQVFDRWFASEAAIEQHVEEQAKPLLDEKPATMTAAEFDAYRASVLNARNDAVNRLLEKTMRSIRAQRLDEFRSQRNEIRAVVAEDVNAEPVFKALDALRSTVKINRRWLVERYGEDAVNRLPKGPIIVSNSGEDVEMVAEAAGFASGAEMVEALFDLAQQTEMLRASGDKRSVRDKRIADRVNEEMEALGASDPLRDDAIEAEALGAIHGERQGEVFSTELRALGKLTGKTVTPYRAAREWAARRIRQSRVHEAASRSAIQRYARAAAKEGRLAEEAYAKGDHLVAFRHKQAQLINHALVAEGRKAGDEVERIAKRLGRIAKRAAQKSVDAEYFERVQHLLALYEFKPVSQKMLDEAEGFADWAAKQAADGYEVIAPARLILGRDHYSRVTIAALTDLDTAVTSLMALGRLKQRLLDAQEQREFDAVMGDIVGRIAQLPQRKLSNDRNEDDRVVASAVAGLLKIETIAEELDGGTQGPSNRLLVERATERENYRAELRDMALLPIAQAYNSMSGKEKRRLLEKVTLPELPHRGGELDPRNGQPTTMTRMELLAVALNVGNASNFDKLSRGEGWGARNIDAVLQRELTESDWAFVSTVWRSIDRLWPAIAATEREMSGVVPERVEPREVRTPFGTIKGGYYPVVYDPTRSQMAENNAAAAVDDLFGMRAGIGTPKGHTIARTDAAAPIMLSVEGVLFNHVEKVITRAALAPYVRDVMRVTTNARFRSAVDLKLGREYRQQVRPWLQRVVNSGALDTRGLKWWENFLRGARVNLTLVAMGFRWSTGVAQVSGLMSSAGRIGAVGLARGIRTVLRNPAAAQRFVFARSPEMARRSEEMNREVADAFRQMRGKATIINKSRAMAFWHIAMIDRYVVSMPTWLGAFENAIAAGMTDQQASAEGDKAVRMSQGSGREASLANWQSPNSEPMRWLTLFYTYFNVFLQSQWQATRAVKRGNIVKAAVTTFWFAMAAPLADALLSGDLPDTDDGEDDEEGWLGWAIRNMFYHQFSGIPIARDVANYAERQQKGEFATLSTTPVARIEEVAVRAARTLDKAVDLEDENGNFDPAFGEEPDNWVRVAIETPGYFIGLPTGQVAATGQFLWDVNTGAAEPNDFGDWYLGFTKGRVPEGDSEE